jgi:hypothetical protein
MEPQSLIPLQADRASSKIVPQACPGRVVNADKWKMKVEEPDFVDADLVARNQRSAGHL